MADKEYPYITFLGAGCVGKSSLIKRLRRVPVMPEYTPTNCVEVWPMVHSDSGELVASMVDITGQSKLASLSHIIYNVLSKTKLIVYVIDHKSQLGLSRMQWIDKYTTSRGNIKDVTFLVAKTKCGTAGTDAETVEACANIGIDKVHCVDSMTGEGITELESYILSVLLQQ